MLVLERGDERGDVVDAAGLRWTMSARVSGSARWISTSSTCTAPHCPYADEWSKHPGSPRCSTWRGRSWWRTKNGPAPTCSANDRAAARTSCTAWRPGRCVRARQDRDPSSPTAQEPPNRPIGSPVHAGGTSRSGRARCARHCGPRRPGGSRCSWDRRTRWVIDAEHVGDVGVDEPPWHTAATFSPEWASMISSTAATTPDRNSCGSTPAVRWTSPVSTSCQPGRPSALSCSIGMYWTPPGRTRRSRRRWPPRSTAARRPARRFGSPAAAGWRRRRGCARRRGTRRGAAPGAGPPPKLRVRRTLEALHTLRQGVPDEQQLHRLSCYHTPFGLPDRLG